MKGKRSLVLLGSALLLAASASGQTSSSREELFSRALSVLSRDRVPPRLRVAERVAGSPGCATFIVAQVRRDFHLFTAEQRRILRPLIVRPNLPENIVTGDGRFRVHFTRTGSDAVPATDSDGDGVPDFVEEVARAFERSWQVEIDSLGYLKPPDDAGVDGPEYDVYIQDLGERFYGFTQSESDVPGTPQDDVRSYVVLDNDFNNNHFTTGVRGARVTAAHEFFHAIQFSYRNVKTAQEPFYYELCSIWMEDVVYDAINDYYQYLPSFFRRRDEPFNKFVPSNFGEAVWDHFLVSKYGDIDLVRTTWERMRGDLAPVPAIDATLRDVGSSFASEFAEFGVWNYFTDGRADPAAYYEEGAAYPAVHLDGDFPLNADTTIAGSSLGLTHKSYRFTVQAAESYELLGRVDKPDDWLFGVIVSQPDAQSSFRIVPANIAAEIGFLPQSAQIVVIAVQTRVLRDSELLSNASSERFEFDLRRSTENRPESGITAVYPNPFVRSVHQRLTVEFVLEQAGEAELRIFTADGRRVFEFDFNAADGAGSRAGLMKWDGRDQDGEPVASGLYLIQLRQNDFVDVQKVAVLR
ncbi:MAG: T9SS C-terminal target domain-containing protein [Calditrichaeota bacterium]|nr:MAG: T9SS C-terminal target domain-containing protein [Calditrichota bacterium]